MKKTHRKTETGLLVFCMVLCMLLSAPQHVSAEPALSATAAEQEVYEFATGTMGLNTAAACGIMGNAKLENHFGTGGEDGNFYGLFQWNPDGRSSLEAWCAANGKESTSINGQMSYMYHELSTDYSSVLSMLQSTPDTADGAWNAGYCFSTDYEQPSDDSFSRDCGSAAAEYFPLFYQEYSADAPQAVRLAGDDRYLTAKEIALAAFQDGADEAVLASGEGYADALTAAGLAGAEKAPILLTAKASIPQPTKELIAYWKIKRITIIGGTGAVSVNAEQELRALGVTDIVRLEGSDRYETCLEVYQQNESLFLSNEKNACIIASGSSAADALSISPWAYAYGMPLFLTDGSSMDESLLQAADRYGTVYVLGGQNAVTNRVTDLLTSAVVRFDGADRYDTSAKVAAAFRKDEGTSYNRMGIASGTNAHYADALAGSMLMGQRKTPILLTDGTSGAEFDFLKNTVASDSSVAELDILGGPDCVPEETVRAVRLLW
ncbi:MAG: phage tail tip lysozyme [Lachnospiraceae bacterium]|jgi:putative cell wall-binding protein|nr:phage tail tip lysozyme [Lachnospiraceae bacterium]